MNNGILKGIGKFIFAVIGVLFIRHSIDTGDDLLFSGFFLFYEFYYIGITLPKFLMFIFDPVGYMKERKQLDEMTPGFTDFTLKSATGLIDGLGDQSDRLTIQERHRLEDALRTIDLYQYSDEHKYLNKHNQKK